MTEKEYVKMLKDVRTDYSDENGYIGEMAYDLATLIAEDEDTAKYLKSKGVKDIAGRILNDL